MMVVLLLLVLAVVLAVVLGAGGPAWSGRRVVRPVRPARPARPQVVEEIVYDDRVVDDRAEVVEEIVEEVPARPVAPVTRRRRRIVEY